MALLHHLDAELVVAALQKRSACSEWLDECPILPAALTAVLERRTTPVSPTAFEFIATTAQIGDIRTLPGVMSH